MRGDFLFSSSLQFIQPLVEHFDHAPSVLNHETVRIDAAFQNFTVIRKFHGDRIAFTFVTHDIGKYLLALSLDCSAFLFDSRARAAGGQHQVNNECDQTPIHHLILSA